MRFYMSDHECTVEIQPRFESDKTHLPEWIANHEAYFMDDDIIVFPKRCRAFVVQYISFDGDWKQWIKEATSTQASCLSSSLLQ